MSRGISPTATRLIVAAAIVATLIAIGRPAAGVAVVVTTALLGQVTRLEPSRVAAIERRLGGGVGRTVGAVLLAPVFYLLVAPLALLRRLIGGDPLAPGRWADRNGTRRGSGRTFGPDRELRRAAPRWRVALAAFVVGILAAVVVPPLFEDDDAEVPDVLQGGGHDATATAALANASWVDEASAEFAAAVATGSTYTPYVSASLRDFDGRYVNISGRERRSYETALEGPPAEIWFFGGSSMFGISAQRDLHTIPSEVVRLAEADGVAVRARNFGMPGAVNFQETVLLSQLLLAGEQPDVVVFLDGINDLAVQAHHAYGGLGRLGDVSDLSAPTMRRLLAGAYTGTDLPPDWPYPPIDAGTPVRSADIARGVRRAYGAGLELARILADHEGFALRHYWQPTIYSKDLLVDGEQELLEPLHLDGGRYDSLVALHDDVVDALPAGVVDLGGAWDRESRPVLTDQVHTNELGARLLAGAIHADLVATGAVDGEG